MLNANQYRIRYDRIIIILFVMAVSFRCSKSIYHIGYCWNEQLVIKGTKTIFFIQEMRKFETYSPSITLSLSLPLFFSFNSGFLTVAAAILIESNIFQHHILQKYS